jgi:acyl carrier protein
MARRLGPVAPIALGQAEGGLNVPEIAEVEAKIKKIVAEQMGVAEGEISRETSFVNDLNADSLDTVELVMEFEEEFELNIPDEEAEKIQTVGQAIDHIHKNLSSK